MDRDENMTEEQVEQLLADALQARADEEDIDVRTRTFEDAGVLTNNRGLVISLGDREYQVTIVRSR